MNVVEHQLQLQRHRFSDSGLQHRHGSPVRIAREAAVIDGNIKEKSESSADEAEEAEEGDDEENSTITLAALPEESEGVHET